MKKQIRCALNGFLCGLGLFALGGCAAIKPSTKSSQEIAATGPTIIDVRANPDTYQLNLNMEPIQKAEILADVKDFRNSITEVKLRFIHVPIEVPMKQLAGTTWHAELSSEQLKLLAVSGHTMKYDAEVLATNSRGQTATSREPFQISVKAPDVAQLSG